MAEAREAREPTHPAEVTVCPACENEDLEGQGTQSASRNQRVIDATCRLHGGTRGFTNLVIRKLPDGRIELDSHATGACVLELEESAATEVRDALDEWLG